MSMVLKIGEYQVNICAKRLEDEAFSSRATKAFICDIAANLFRSAWALEADGYKCTADSAREKAHDIHDALDKVGYFDWQVEYLKNNT